MNLDEIFPRGNDFIDIDKIEDKKTYNPAALELHKPTTFITSNVMTFIHIINSLTIDMLKSESYIPILYNKTTTTLGNWLVDEEGFYVDDYIYYLDIILNQTEELETFYLNYINNIREPRLNNNAMKLKPVIETISNIRQLIT